MNNTTAKIEPYISHKSKYTFFLWKVLFFLLISIALELLFFNRASLFSYIPASPRELTYTASEGLIQDMDGSYRISDDNPAYFEISDMEGTSPYLYLDIDCQNEDGGHSPFSVKFAIEDDGNCYYYFLPETTSYPVFEQTKYFHIHSYGDIHKMRVYFWSDTESSFTVHQIVSNAKVPCFFSFPRVCFLFALLLLLWLLRPASELYSIQWSRKSKKIVVLSTLIINVGVWGIMVLLNTPFLNPSWTHHGQYHQLAVALTEGRVWIETGIEKALSMVDNPYDDLSRFHTVDVTPGWDTAFYQGKFYVYFGIVPVLLFYLPYYLVFHSAFPTWLGIFLTSAAVLTGVFFLLRQIIKRWFTNIPFILYVLLALVMGNGIGTIPILLRPDFYSLPILCALCFTIWGLSLWIYSLNTWETGTKSTFSFATGSLCLALTAGCRPQFLMASFLILPLFYSTIQSDWARRNSIFRKQCTLRILALCLPYFSVAAGLMYYNFIRFGSPFDFGASYNITTNDMTHRGFQLARIPDGLFRYLFQFPNLGLRFPFVYNTSMNSEYLGITIQELMFGGIFFTHIFLCILFLLRKSARPQQKQLHGFCLSCLLFGVIIVIADTEMSGLLNRYCSDFLWIFFLPAVIVFLQLWESSQKPNIHQYLISFLLVSGLYSLFIDVCIGFNNLENIHRYYFIKTFFS